MKAPQRDRDRWHSAGFDGSYDQRVPKPYNCFRLVFSEAGWTKRMPGLGYWARDENV